MQNKVEWVQEVMQKALEMTLPGKTLAVAGPAHLLRLL